MQRSEEIGAEWAHHVITPIFLAESFPSLESGSFFKQAWIFWLYP